MEENSSPVSPENKNVLPDVVHTQPISSAVGPAVASATGSTINEAVSAKPKTDENDSTVTDVSEAESISDHVLSKFDYSLSESGNLSQNPEQQPSSEALVNSNRNDSLNIPQVQSTCSEPHNKSSWLAEVNVETNNLSDESPVAMPASSESKQDESPNSTPQFSSHVSLAESSKHEFLDSLNDKSIGKDSLDSISGNKTPKQDSNSNSEEIIKLDIRGSGVPKFPFSAAKIIFGPLPDGSVVVEPDIEAIPVFPNLLSPFLVSGGDSAKIEELFQSPEISKEPSPAESFSDKEADLLVEELTVNETKEKKADSIPQPKSIPPEDGSFSTFTTDYKTICEEYHEKLTHLEAAITDRDKIIQQRNISLQQCIQELETLKAQNENLDKEQLSDLVKYQSLIKDDTKYYSALTSNPSSIHSNSEKDMDNEEMTVDYSKTSDSDLTGFDAKLTETLAQFEDFIAENIRNELREGLVRVYCEEVGKIRLESDTEMRELETQMKQDKHAFTLETRKLRDLLASVKAGDADIDVLRKELSAKHEKEMENLRTYFEKKCSDMERSYSEEVWRGKNCVSPVSCSSVEGAGGAVGVAGGAGDGPRRRTRSAELPSLNADQCGMDQAAKQHAACVTEIQRHKEAIVALEDQILQLKAHIQTTENTEPLYQQDIDMELEKALDGSEMERLRKEITEQLSLELQEKIQVLLSDPDAEPGGWPVELVALRDKIHGEALEKELSNANNESEGADKWRQRRNHSFDQNRHLEQVTKERDDLRRVAGALQRVVAQLVAYCAAADDELNRTVLAELLQRALYHDNPVPEDESRPSTPNLSTDLNCSAVARASRRVHFAPELPGLAGLDEEQLLAYFQEQRDLSLDVKRELELSLKRLRNEAQELLDLSTKVGKNKGEYKMLESSQVKITELVDEIDSRQHCNNCEMHRKNLEEEMAECVQREGLLRADLEAAKMQIAQLMGGENVDFIAEGYGLVANGSSRPSATLSRVADSRSVSLDASPRSDLARLAHELEMVHREKEDLMQQLEAANRQLRSSRQFIEEQATEREAERDEYSRNKEELREENARLASRLQSNARIVNEMVCLKLTECNCRQHDAHVEQLESQMREMNQLIVDLETKKTTTDDELKASSEKISLLRDIISTLEQQLEQRIAHEAEVVNELEGMRRTIDERDRKMRELLSELEALRSERIEASTFCSKCMEVEEGDILDEIKEQARCLEQCLHHRTRQLERIHETSSVNCSEPSEDVSLLDQRNQYLELASGSPSPRAPRHALFSGVWGCLDAHTRAEHAAIKHIADLTRTAQEVRAERDVLQARMSEQALKLSSLAAKLEQQRTHAEAAAKTAAGDLSVKLHDALAEVQRLTEEVQCKDKQLERLKLCADDRGRPHSNFEQLYGKSRNPQEKVKILERELSSTQTRLGKLERVARSLEEERDTLRKEVRESRRMLAEREDQLQEILALKIDEENNKSEIGEEIIIEAAKTSARTLSDIVSISDYDEQDLQMRKAEFRQNMTLNAPPYPNGNKEKSLNRTLPPELLEPTMSSLNIDCHENHDLAEKGQRSLPAQLTSTQNSAFLNRTMKHDSTKIKDNCSLYPNRDVNDTKDNSIDPKKINFSIEPDNKTEEFTSLRELGIALDMKQENFPDILSQLKNAIKKSKSELDLCKTELKNAEEQLCEFPALKEEVEALKAMLENTMVTMDNDKKFYENQLENFTSNKNMLEQKLTEMTQEVADKAKDLHLLKEDILRRENMVLELAKEKRNLTNKMTELEVKIDELKSKNATLEKYEKDNVTMRDQISELKKLEQLVSEKNQQIDSLNQHLDRLDDMQRRLDDKTEEVENMKELLEEKSNEVFQMQETIEALNKDLANVHEENEKLNICNKDLKQKLTKMEKEQENQSLKQRSNETEVSRLTSINNELTSKIEDLKQLTEKLRDRETEIEMLNEDIQLFHEEIASLKEQLKISRSPSPRSKEDKKDRGASYDKRQLAKIRRQVALLQHELDFHSKELNDKAFELARAKLDITELTANLSAANKNASDRENQNKLLTEENEELTNQITAINDEKNTLEEQLQLVLARMREEGNVSELKQKLNEKTEQCRALTRDLTALRDQLERVQESDNRALAVPGTRSPTAELERAFRDQLDYSTKLDEDIMDQILSASSDNEDIPRLALNTSKSSSSIHSASSETLRTLRSEKEKLTMQVSNLEARIRDKDALIAELNRVRDKLVQDWQASQLRSEAERDNCARLQLQLDTYKETAESLQSQDSNMISILKKRLESAMGTELELQQQLREARSRLSQLQKRLPPNRHGDPLHDEIDNNERLQGELSLLRSKLDVERTRYLDLQSALDQTKTQMQRQLDEKSQALAVRGSELLDARRLKHEAAVELVRAKELLGIQASTIAELEQKLTALGGQRRAPDVLSEFQEQKTELSREMATLKQCLRESNPDLSEVRRLKAEVNALQNQLARQTSVNAPDDRDQAIRYLHARCIRLESCRKALVWQKRYLQRVAAGYEEIEARLAPASKAQSSRGGQRFRCVARAVLIVCRMSFLVRRRRAMRAASSTLSRPANPTNPTNPATSQKETYVSSTQSYHSPPSREAPRHRPDMRLNLGPDNPSRQDPKQRQRILTN